MVSVRDLRDGQWYETPKRYDVQVDFHFGGRQPYLRGLRLQDFESTKLSYKPAWEVQLDGKIFDRGASKDQFSSPDGKNHLVYLPYKVQDLVLVREPFARDFKRIREQTRALRLEINAAFGATAKAPMLGEALGLLGEALRLLNAINIDGVDNLPEVGKHMGEGYKALANPRLVALANGLKPIFLDINRANSYRKGDKKLGRRQDLFVARWYLLRAQRGLFDLTIKLRGG